METNPKSWTVEDLRHAVNRYEAMLQTSDVARTTLYVYVAHSERFVNWLDGAYAPRVKKRGGAYGNDVINSKYDALRVYLRDREEPTVRMTFREIENIVGFRLPMSARMHHHWWANDQTGTHPQASAWMRVDRRVRMLNVITGTVAFVRADRDFRAGSGEIALRRTPSA